MEPEQNLRKNLITTAADMRWVICCDRRELSDGGLFGCCGDINVSNSSLYLLLLVIGTHTVFFLL